MHSDGLPKGFIQRIRPSITRPLRWSQFRLGFALPAPPIPGIFSASGPLTARQVVDRIKQHLGIPWNEKTYRDVFHAGDPLYKFKRNYIEQNGMMIFRLHDHWHARKPDGIFEGWNRALGWEKLLVPGDNRTWDLPPTTLRAVAGHVAKSLETRSLRIVGDPDLLVRRVGRGAHTLAGNMAALSRVDALLVSEAREWDSIEYMRDAALTGEKKGLILISHEAGEEAGMDNFASWLKAFVREVPVEFIPTRDQMWIPA